MLVENTREETLKAFLNGIDTRVAVKSSEGGSLFVHISELLPEDAVYFINVDVKPEDDYEQKVLNDDPGGEPGKNPPDTSRKRDGTVKKPKAKSARDIIEPWVRQGFSDSEIAEKTGIKYGTVWAAAKPIRKQLEESKGRNADRHLCENCKYRASAYSKTGRGIKCEYALKSDEKHCRIIDVDDCDKYEKGAPIKVKEE